MNRLSSKISFTLLLVVTIMLLSSCEKEISTSPEELPPEKGTLILSSNPPNAKIILNGRNSGFYTPDTINWLPDTTHEIVLQKSYYRDTTLHIETHDGTTKNVEVDYTQNSYMYGRLIIESEPTNGVIYLDGQNTNANTPDTMFLVTPGKHSITVYHDGYREVNEEVEVFSLQYTRANLALQDTSVWVSYHTSNSSIPTNSFTCIELDDEGRKWLGTSDTGLVIYDGINYEVWNTSNTPLPANNILCLKFDHLGKMWIGTEDGLAIYDHGNWRIIDQSNAPLPSNYISSLDVGPLGDALIGTRFGLARLYTDDHWVILTENNSGVPADWITSVMFDGDNDFYAAVFNTGLTRFFNIQWSTYGIPGPHEVGGSWKLSDVSLYKNITAMAVGQGVDRWFGNSEAGGASSRAHLIYFNGDRNWKVQKDLGENQVNSIYVDPTNTVWVSTHRGLINLRTNLSSYTFDMNNSHLMSNHIKGCSMDENGIIWIATLGGGLTKKKPGQ